MKSVEALPVTLRDPEFDILLKLLSTIKARLKGELYVSS